MDATFFANLASEVEIPADGTISRTLYQDDKVKVVLFGFAAGQELSEHTASVPATVHFLDGQAELTLADQRVSASAGTWAHMPANLPHSISAKTDTRMLLMMLKAGKP